MYRPPSRARPTFAIRLAVEERRVIEAAAAAAQEYVGGYIRRAALDAARRALAGQDGEPDHRTDDR